MRQISCPVQRKAKSLPRTLSLKNAGTRGRKNDGPDYVEYLTIEAFDFRLPSVATAPPTRMHPMEVSRDLRRLFYTFQAASPRPIASGVPQLPLSYARRLSDDRSEGVIAFVRVQLLDPPRHCPERSDEIAR